MEGEEIFRQRLRNLRSKIGLSQQKTADGIGMTKVGYQNYEAGRQTPNFIMLPRLAKYFNVSTDYLLGLSDEPQLPDKEEWAMLKQMRAYRDKKTAVK